MSCVPHLFLPPERDDEEVIRNPLFYSRNSTGGRNLAEEACDGNVRAAYSHVGASVGSYWFVVLKLAGTTVPSEFKVNVT